MPSAANKLLANALLDPSWKPIGGGLGVLPLGEDEQGNVGFGIPGILRNPLVSAERSWLDTLAESSGIKPGDYLDEGTRYEHIAEPMDAFDAASLAPIAGVVMKAARPNASAVARVAEEPGLASVPLDSYPPAPADYWFHGTQNSGFDKYVPDINRRPNGGFNGVSITPYPSEASSYSYFDTAGPDATPGVYPLKVDVQNPFTWDILNPEDGFNRMDQYFPGMKRGGDIWTGERDWELSNALRDAGFDAIDIVEGPKMLERAVIAPGRVRSALTGEVFFSNPDEAATVPLMARALEQEGALPMDQASRLKRAAEQGYDTGKVWYHGTDRDIAAFEPTTGASGASGVYLTDSPDVASFYAQARGGENASVYPVHVKTFGPFNDYFKAADGSTSIAVPPNSIRSVNAAFDPSKVGMNGLLFSNSDEAAMAPLLARALEGEQGIAVNEFAPGRYNYDMNGTRLQVRSDAPDAATITQLYTAPEQRGQGQARALLDLITRGADQSGTRLALDVMPGDVGIDAQRLEDFYRSFGFEGSGRMERPNALLADPLTTE